MQGTIYSTETGEIYMAMSGPDEESIRIQLPLYDKADYILGEYLKSADWYLPEGVKTPRPTMQLTQSAVMVPIDESFVIQGIPVGSRVIGPNVDVTVNDGSVEWQSAVPGEFQFEVIHFPHKPQVITIESVNL